MREYRFFGSLSCFFLILIFKFAFRNSSPIFPKRNNFVQLHTIAISKFFYLAAI